MASYGMGWEDTPLVAEAVYSSVVVEVAIRYLQAQVPVPVLVSS